MDATLLTLALVIGFYMLWNIGANDVANAMGTSVGSGAISLRKAIIIAAILEFSGAFFLGSNVTETIQSGIIDPGAFAQDPMTFVLGMLSALLATAVWLQIATFFGWPVSTTHAIVGAVLGFGAIQIGVSAVHWSEVGMIAVSWIASPILSGIVAYLLFAFIQRKILFSYAPLRATKKIVPYLVFVVLTTFFISIGANGIKNLNLHLPLYTVILCSMGIGLIGFFITKIASMKIDVGAKMPVEMADRQEEQLFRLNRVRKHLIRTKLASTGPHRDNLSEMLEKVSNMILDVKDRSKWETHVSSDYMATEKIFASLQLLSACFVAFAHGANDVANAIGPVAAVIQIIKNPQQIQTVTHTPLWLLAFGGTGIVIGLATYGYKVMRTIGHKITQLTPTRGFSAEFGAAATILVASKLGLPISTTHAIVGAVLGVGFARGISALNIRMIRDIFLSWFITIPSAAISSMLLFNILKLIF